MNGIELKEEILIWPTNNLKSTPKSEYHNHLHVLCGVKLFPKDFLLPFRLN